MLDAIVENLDDVDEKYHELYEERDGKFHLKQIKGLRTEADIQRLQTSLNKERTAHKDTRQKFAIFDGIDLNEAKERLDSYDELKAAAEGKMDGPAIEAQVERRLNAKLAPVQRELTQTKEKLTEAESRIQGFETSNRTRTISDHIREAAVKEKILPDALDDALLLGERVFEVDEDGNVVTKDGKGFTSGVSASVWLTEVKSKRPHWWPDSVGGGSAGSRSGDKGSNPFTHENWNLTEQGKLITENRSKAEQLAKAAGTTIGGKKPQPKNKR